MEAGNSARSGQRIVALESVRALMAMWVLLGHCGNYLGHFLGQPAPAWIKPLLLTSTPVDIFIVLSGFVIFELLHRSAKVGYRDYITRRARRILPIYFFAIALAILLSDLRLDAFIDAPWRTVEEVEAALARASETRADLGLHLALHAALLHGVVPDQWLPNSAYALLAPAWSLSLEWQLEPAAQI